MNKQHRDSQSQQIKNVPVALGSIYVGKWSPCILDFLQPFRSLRIIKKAGF